MARLPWVRMILVSSSRVSFTRHVPPRSHCASCPAQKKLYVAFPFLRSYQVLVWHHCHQVFTSCSARQTRPLPFFPRGCAFSMVTTIACCSMPFRTSTLAVGRVAHIAKRWLPKLLCYSTAHCGFSQRRMLSLLLCLDVLPTRCLLHDSRLLGLPLLSVVATGFLWHAGGWHLRRKPCVVLLLFLLDWF